MLQNEFFPTPPSVCRKMWEQINHKDKGMRVLDPSAGAGALLDRFVSQSSYSTRHSIYAIEIDQDLRYVLTGKKIKVIGSDFLTYSEPVEFDLVIMNPPFSAGVKHTLKAWDLVAGGGQLICLLNTESVTNICTKERALLIDTIDRFNGYQIDLGQCFKDSERPTNVNVSMIVITKPEAAKSFDFSSVKIDFDQLETPEFMDAPLAHPQPIKNLVARYKVAETLVAEKFKAQQRLAFYLTGICDVVHNSADRKDVDTVHAKIGLQEQIAILKSQFWNTVFQKTKIGSRTTSKFQKDFHQFAIDQSSMAFTEGNIMEVLALFINNNQQIMRDCLVEVFDKATSYHEKNRIHTEGWKTNKSYKIGNRIIIPRGVAYSYNSFSSNHYHWDFLRDLDKVLCWAAKENFEAINTLADALSKHISAVNGYRGQDKLDYQSWGESEFFRFKIHKKGTLWLDFKDRQMLDAFNRHAAEGKKWIGGDY